MSPQEFIDRVVNCGVIEEEVLRTLLDGIPPGERPDHVTKMGRLLVQRGLLTRHQAAEIFQGTGHSLVLGNYVILDKVGEGGMGEVFRARHRVMDRIVAIKVLSQKMVDSPDVVRRFYREVRAAAKLIHPNIVTAYDAAEANGRHFLVMEYVDGDDLADVVDRDGRLSIEDAVDFTIQAADGLAYAHAQGIIHRDVKPHNLLLSQQPLASPGQSGMLDARTGPIVKILDMGLVRFEQVAREGDVTTDHLSFTQDNQIMGTVDYMSPEQAENTHGADQRSDIYSLGCTFYRMLTGCPLYSGDTAMSKLIAHREQPIPPLSQARPDAPARLEEVFAKMVAKDPDDRFQSMAEVSEAMRPFSSHALITAVDADEPVSDSTDADDDNVLTEDSALWQFMQSQQSASAMGKSSPSQSTPAAPANINALEGESVVVPGGAPAAAPPKPRKRTDTDVIVQTDHDTSQRVPNTLGKRRRKPGMAVHVVGVVIGGCLAVLIAFGIVAALWLFPSTQAPEHAELQIDWPALQRQDAKLLVNDEQVEFDGEDLLKVQVEPGICVVIAMRRGYQTINREFQLVAGEARPVALDWAPIPDMNLPDFSGFDPDREIKTAELLKKWPNFFQQYVDKQAAQSDERKTASAEAQRQIDAALQAGQEAASFEAARAAAMQFWRQHGATAEAALLGTRLQLLPAPADALNRSDIAPRELMMAGAGNPADATSQLVCVLGDSRLMHTQNYQFAIAFAPDNRTFATAGRSLVIRLWDAQTGEDKMSLKSHTGDILAVAFGPRGELLASGGRDKSIRIWDLSRQTTKLTLRSTNAMEVSSLVFDPQGDWLASGSKDQIVRIWDVQTGQRRKEISGHTGSIAALAASADGKWLASATLNGEVRIYDTMSWEPAAQASTDGVAVYSLAFHPSSAQLVGGLNDGNVAVWSLQGALVRTLEWGQAPLYSVQFTPDGKKLAAQSTKEGCRVWNYEDGKVHLDFNTGGQYMAMSPDGKLLASATLNGEVRIYDTMSWEPAAQASTDGVAVYSLAFHPSSAQLVGGLNDGNVAVWSLQGALVRTLEWGQAPLYSVQFTPDGKKLAAQSTKEGCRVWNYEDGKVHLDFNTGGQYMAMSPDGKLLATCTQTSPEVRVWTHLGQVQLQRQGHAGPVQDVSFTTDGKQIVSAGFDGTLRIWDTATSRLLHTLRGHTGRTIALACSPDDNLVASAGDDKTVRLWSLKSATEVQTLSEHTLAVLDVAYSLDGRWLASGGADMNVFVWDAQTRLLKHKLSGHLTPVRTVALSNDGVWLASGSDDGEVRLWSAADGVLRLVLKDHTASVKSVAFHPDGQSLASAGVGRRIILTDLATGEMTAELVGHGDAISSIAYTPDGALLVSAGETAGAKRGELMIWDVETTSALRRIDGPLGAIKSLAVGPFGRYIATAHGNGTVEVFRAKSPTPSP